MRNFKVSEHLQNILSKLQKRDRRLYSQLLKKINEIISSHDVEHFKSLKHNMKDSKRVHISHFVLVFQYDKSRDELCFDDFAHHDQIYK
jgi:YafQ family addiction module toxin component